MPRVHFVKSARKDIPAYGIVRGDSYWWWEFYRRPKICSKTRPRPSQLTESRWSEVLASWEAIEDTLGEGVDGIRDRLDSIKDGLEQLAGECEDIAGEKRELADEQFHGEGVHAEQADAFEEAQQAAEEAAQAVEDIDLDEDDEGLHAILQDIVDGANPGNFQI